MMAIYVVVSNVQAAIRPLIANFLQALREILQNVRTQIETCGEEAARLRTIPDQATSSGGRRRYIISAEQIEVLRSTGMQWKAIAYCVGVSPKTLYRRIEYAIADAYSEITEQELERNMRCSKVNTFFWRDLHTRGLARTGHLHPTLESTGSVANY